MLSLFLFLALVLLSVPHPSLGQTCQSCTGCTSTSIGSGQVLVLSNNVGCTTSANQYAIAYSFNVRTTDGAATLQVYTRDDPNSQLYYPSASTADPNYVYNCFSFSNAVGGRGSKIYISVSCYGANGCNIQYTGSIGCAYIDPCNGVTCSIPNQQCVSVPGSGYLGGTCKCIPGYVLTVNNTCIVNQTSSSSSSSTGSGVGSSTGRSSSLSSTAVSSATTIRSSSSSSILSSSISAQVSSLSSSSRSSSAAQSSSALSSTAMSSSSRPQSSSVSSSPSAVSSSRVSSTLSSTIISSSSSSNRPSSSSAMTSTAAGILRSSTLSSTSRPIVPSSSSLSSTGSNPATLCDSVDCGSHGSCDLSTGYCRCSAGWTGYRCNIIDRCQNVNCNQGFCQADGSCKCLAPYTGADCSISPCAGFECGSGRCFISSDLTPQCLCPDYNVSSTPCLSTPCSLLECPTGSQCNVNTGKCEVPLSMRFIYERYVGSNRCSGLRTIQVNTQYSPGANNGTSLPYLVSCLSTGLLTFDLMGNVSTLVSWAKCNRPYSLFQANQTIYLPCAGKGVSLAANGTLQDWRIPGQCIGQAMVTDPVTGVYLGCQSSTLLRWGPSGPVSLSVPSAFVTFATNPQRSTIYFGSINDGSVIAVVQSTSTSIPNTGCYLTGSMTFDAITGYLFYICTQSDLSSGVLRIDTYNGNTVTRFFLDDPQYRFEAKALTIGPDQTLLITFTSALAICDFNGNLEYAITFVGVTITSLLWDSQRKLLVLGQASNGEIYGITGLTYCPDAMYYDFVSRSCQLCAVNTMCPLYGLKRVGNFCPGGSYLPVLNAPTNACQKCPVGFSCAGGFARPVRCTSSPAANWSAVYCPIGSASWAYCKSGYFCPNSSALLQCPIGYFCPTGSFSPRICSNGYYCPSAGLSAPVLCPVNYFCLNDSSTRTITPRPCEPQFDCTQAGTAAPTLAATSSQSSSSDSLMSYIILAAIAVAGIAIVSLLIYCYCRHKSKSPNGVNYHDSTNVKRGEDTELASSPLQHYSLRMNHVNTNTDPVKAEGALSDSVKATLQSLPTSQQQQQFHHQQQHSSGTMPGGAFNSNFYLPPNQV